MSQNILILSPKVFKDRMSVHTNIDEKLIEPEIKVVQDMYLEPLLGTGLFTKILTIVGDGTITQAGNADYKTLVDTYLIDMLCYYVMAEMPDSINYQFTNKGVLGKTSDDSSQPSMSELYSIVSKYKNRAEHYAKRAKMYLLQKVGEGKYPEYANPGQTIDTVMPDRQSYSSPFYLGEDFPKVKRSFEERNQGFRPNCD
jgi:hypothetical protein